MKSHIKKLFCVLLIFVLLDVSAFADEEEIFNSLSISTNPTAEQLSFSNATVVDDFEASENADWSPLYATAIGFSSDAVCGASSMQLNGNGNIGAQITAGGFGSSSVCGVTFVFKADVDCTLITKVDSKLTSSASVRGGKWYTACADIRTLGHKSDKRTLNIECQASGDVELLIDYVSLSVTYTSHGNVIDIADGISAHGADSVYEGGMLAISATGKNFYIETPRIDRILENGINAVAISMENSASATEATLYYSKEGENFKSRNSHTLTLTEGIKTYVFPLTDCTSLCRLKLEFKGNPTGQILIRDVRLSYTSPRDESVLCEVTDGGRIHFVCPPIEDAQENRIYLFRSLPNIDADMQSPYMSSQNGEFVFDVIDGGINNLLYKFTAAYYDKDGNAVAITPPTGVSRPEKASKANAHTEVYTKKGIYGASALADTAYIPIDADMFFAKLTTEYSYQTGESKIYFATEAAKELDETVLRLSNQGRAVYLCPTWYNVLPHLYNSAETEKLSAFTGYLSQRYNGGEYGTINGIVLGTGANLSSMPFARAVVNCEAALYVANASAKYENGAAEIILAISENSDAGHDMYDFSCAVLSSCPYANGVMLYADHAASDDAFASVPAREFAEFLELQSNQPLFVNISDCGQDTFGAVKDFYSLCFKDNVKGIAYSISDAFVKTDAFKYMDTANAEKYTSPLCTDDSWQTLIFDYDISHFKNNTIAETTFNTVAGNTVSSDDVAIFSPEEGGNASWVCGMGCSSVSYGVVYGEACACLSFDGAGISSFKPSIPVSIVGKTLKIRLRVDYLPTGVDNASVIFTAVNGTQRVSATSTVSAKEETTLLLNIGDFGIKTAERFEIGVLGEYSPRICLYGVYLSDDKEEDISSSVTQAQTDAVTETDTDGQNNTSSAPIIAAVSVFMAVCLAVAVYIIDKKNGGALLGKFFKKNKQNDTFKAE